MYIDLVAPWSKVPCVEHPTKVYQNINIIDDLHAYSGTLVKYSGNSQKKSIV